MKNIQLIIFDIDGTLIDSREDIASAANMMRVEYGLEILPLETVTGYVGDGVKKLVTRSLQGHAADISEAIEKYRTHYTRRMLDMTTLYPGVKEGIEKLHKAGYRLGIVSNKPGDACVKILEHFGIAKFFDMIIGGDGRHPLKPDPASIIAILEKTGSAPDKSWMMGDSLMDLEAARRAGVKCCYAAYGFFNLDPSLFDMTVNSFEDFSDFLLSNEKSKA